MRDFKKYTIWESRHKLTLMVYKIKDNFPKSELFGLTSQMRRASASVPTNIAEGCGRESDIEFKRFLIIASGSASELLYLLILSKDIGYISNEQFEEFEIALTTLRKSIHQLIKKIAVCILLLIVGF